MKIFRAFGPTIGKGKLSKEVIKKINNFIDNTTVSKKNDYSSKLSSQIKDEIKLSNIFIKKNLTKQLIKNIKIYLNKSGLIKLKISK